VDIADIEGNGFDDVITANDSPVLQGAGSALPVFTLFRGSATGLGNPVPIALPNAVRGHGVTLVDVDSDGDRDIVAVYGLGDGSKRAVLLRVDDSASTDSISITLVGEPLGDGALLLSSDANLDGKGGNDVLVVSGESALAGLLTTNAAPFLGVGPSCPSDLDGDGEVSASDLAVVLIEWGLTGSGDINNDGFVDSKDLGLVLSNWGACPR